MLLPMPCGIKPSIVVVIVVVAVVAVVFTAKRYAQLMSLFHVRVKRCLLCEARKGYSVLRTHISEYSGRRPSTIMFLLAKTLFSDVVLRAGRARISAAGEAATAHGRVIRQRGFYSRL